METQDPVMYTLNPEFVDYFLQLGHTEANKYFLAILLLVAVQNEFSISLPELATFMQSSERSVNDAVRYFVHQGIFLLSSHIDPTPADVSPADVSK